MTHVLVALAFAASGVPSGQAHDKPYWRAIVEASFKVPAGETAQRLAPELIAALGSDDPELRDDLAMAILSRWTYQEGGLL